MKTRSLRIILFLLALLPVLHVAEAASRTDGTTPEAPLRMWRHAEVSSPELKMLGEDSVEVRFTLRTSARKLSAREIFVLRPFVSNAGQSLYLRPVEIARPYKFRNERRSRILAGNRQEPVEMLVEAGEEVAYEMTWRYEEWMEHLTLSVESYYEGCGARIYDRTTRPLIANRQLYFPPVYVSPRISEVAVPKHLIEQMAAQSSFIHADKGDDETTMGRSRSLAFSFRQGQSRLDMSLDQNREHMERVNAALRAIEGNPDVRLREVRLMGYASVEGSRTTNERLALERAKAVYTGIDAAVRPSMETMRISSGGENWEDLRREVEADTLCPRRDEVLRILTQEPDTEKRKAQLRALGTSYAYLLKNIFPRQRSAGYLQLFFDVIRRSDANQQSALRYNEAVAHAAARRYDEALALLENPGVKLPEAQAANLRGVCLWMQGKAPEARGYFRLALEADPQLADARENLAALEAWDEHTFFGKITVTPAPEDAPPAPQR